MQKQVQNYVSSIYAVETCFQDGIRLCATQSFPCNLSFVAGCQDVVEGRLALSSGRRSRMQTACWAHAIRVGGCSSSCFPNHWFFFLPVKSSFLPSAEADLNTNICLTSVSPSQPFSLTAGLPLVPSLLTQNKEKDEWRGWPCERTCHKRRRQRNSCPFTPQHTKNSPILSISI